MEQFQQLPQIDVSLLNAIAPVIAQQHQILPVAFEGEALVLLAKNPTEKIEATLKFVLNRKELRIAGPEEFEVYRRNFEALMDKYFPSVPINWCSAADDFELADRLESLGLISRKLADKVREEGVLALAEELPPDDVIRLLGSFE